MTEIKIDEQRYLSFCFFLEKACGIVLGENKQYLVRSRLSPLVHKLQYESIDDLIDAILLNKDKLQNMAIEAMTTNETLWFRDQYPFSILEQTLLDKFASQSRRMRIWSAACSSGQEAYSIAITILNYQKRHKNSFAGGVEILGTDISEQMVRHCRDAEYDQLALARGLPEPYRHEYFTLSNNDKLKLNAQVTALTQFKQLNLLQSYASLGQFDIIFCRNVLIYFSEEVKKQILQKIAACLQEGGVLFLGASESIADLTNILTPVRCNSGLYYLKKAP
ncbi:CheR family methyltransferase [Paraglaciecola aestuariivivens]